jgi:hypothetical protein
MNWDMDLVFTIPSVEFLKLQLVEVVVKLLLPKIQEITVQIHLQLLKIGIVFHHLLELTHVIIQELHGVQILTQTSCLMEIAEMSSLTVKRKEFVAVILKYFLIFFKIIKNI